MYDLIIIGAGPAGITAAVYAARKRLNILVLTGDIGGQAALSGDIENYTGYQFISGPELAKKFEEHVKKFNVDLRTGHEVERILKKGWGFEVFSKGEAFETRAVIIATGRKPKTLGVPGESEFKNRGVTYCATCDAPLFTDKEVVVVGGGNSALDAILQLIKIARKVHVVNIAESLTGDKVLIEKVQSSGKVLLHNSSTVKRIEGDSFVRRVIINDGETLSVEGVFIEIGGAPAGIPVEGAKLALSPGKEIKVDEHCRTSIPGIFACGDVSTVPEWQIIVAAGHGCIACLAAFKYLSRLKH